MNIYATEVPANICFKCGQPGTYVFKDREITKDRFVQACKDCYFACFKEKK